MQDHELDNLSKFYEKNGYVSPVKLLSEAETAKHRNRLEEAEKQLGSLHYRSKVHTILTSPFELATSSKVLDLIEASMPEGTQCEKFKKLVQVPLYDFRNDILKLNAGKPLENSD